MSGARTRRSTTSRNHSETTVRKPDTRGFSEQVKMALVSGVLYTQCRNKKYLFLFYLEDLGVRLVSPVSCR